jgi:long-chain fatty acid transport protein
MPANRSITQTRSVVGMSSFALLAVVASTGTALAGGFAPKEQSVYFQGMSFAGAAAGGALSSMFWNSAAVGQFDGINSDSNYSLILPDSEITATAGSTLLANGAKSGDIGDSAVLPASYFSYQLNNEIVLGMSVNAPFGLTTDPSNYLWAGVTQARESKIETYNFNPTVAYRVAPGVIVGAGLQIEYFKAQLRQSSGVLITSPEIAIKGDDVDVGFTAGILVTPMAGTTIGVGFRLSIDHELEGEIKIASAAVPLALREAAITAGIETPEMITASLRQELAPAWTLLGTVEWTNWSNVQQLVVNCKTPGSNALFCPPPATATVRTLDLGWHDGWFFSGGLEHEYSSQLTLRGGVAYEISPIRAADERTIRVPDADRIWLSAGASYKYSEWTTIDLAYSHVFVEDATVDRTESGVRVVGDVESSVDIISVGVRSKLDWLLSGG